MSAVTKLLSNTGLSAEDRRLRVEMSIKPSDECSCPIKEAAEKEMNIDEVRRKTSKQTCESDLVVSGDGEVVNTATPVQEECFCPVFETFGVLPQVEEVKNKEIIVSAYISDRRDMKSVLKGLRSKAENVRLMSIKAVGEDKDEPESARINLSEMTPKQRETLKIAVIGGYYDDPPKMTLEDLSKEFGVSKSAISQRLSRAESKLVVNAFSDS